MPVLQAMQVLVAPVVMISAGGLLCLALYNRLAMIVSRLRAFHKELFDALTRLEAMGEGVATAEGRRLRNRREVLDRQVKGIFRRARLVRSALVLLLVMVLCMLGCSLALGLTLVVEEAAYAAFVLFCLGVVAMGASMKLAIWELAGALDLVQAEREALEEIHPAA